MTGRRRWYIIGCYIAPDDARTIERVVTALGDQPRGTALIVAGDLNMDLGDMASDGRGTEIATAITEAGLEDMTAHFLPRKRKWGIERRMWSMVRGGKAIRSRTDYILGTDRSLFGTWQSETQGITRITIWWWDCYGEGRRGNT